MLGYSDLKRGYCLYSFDSKKIAFSKHVKFYEDIFPFKISHNFCPKSVDIDGLNCLNFFDCIFVDDKNANVLSCKDLGASTSIAAQQEMLNNSNRGVNINCECDLDFFWWLV